MLPLKQSDFIRGGGGYTPVNKRYPFWNALWSAPAYPALSLSWYPHPAVMWHYQQYCDVMSSIVMSPAVLKSMFCAINCLHRNLPNIIVLLFPNFTFYYWYLFNFIENGLNVKDKRRFEEKKTKIISHKALKQDIRCRCTERDETKVFKRLGQQNEFVSAKFHISIIKAVLLVGALPPLFALLLC